jgi:hypothetical protein
MQAFAFTAAPTVHMSHFAHSLGMFVGTMNKYGVGGMCMESNAPTERLAALLFQDDPATAARSASHGTKPRRLRV